MSFPVVESFFACLSENNLVDFGPTGTLHSSPIPFFHPDQVTMAQLPPPPARPAVCKLQRNDDPTSDRQTFVRLEAWPRADRKAAIATGIKFNTNLAVLQYDEMGAPTEIQAQLRDQAGHKRARPTPKGIERPVELVS